MLPSFLHSPRLQNLEEKLCAQERKKIIIVVAFGFERHGYSPDLRHAGFEIYTIARSVTQVQYKAIAIATRIGMRFPESG